MKKLILIIVSLAAAVSVSGCSLAGEVTETSNPTVETAAEPVRIDEKDYELALITDSKGIEDEADLKIWKSIIAYGDSNSKTYKYYQTEDNSDGSAEIEQAADHGARIIVLPDPSYRDIVKNAGEKYPHVSFILLDDQPEKGLPENVMCVKFKEEQAGYIAGYLSVVEGYKCVGFLADADNDRNTRYLYGLVQGADDATQKLRLHDVTVKYMFTGGDEKRAESAANELYKNGVEVIFACNDNIVKGSGKAAKDRKKKIICGEKIYSDFSEEMLTSIEFNTTKAIEYSIKNYFSDDLDLENDGTSMVKALGVENGCIDIPKDDELWNFKKTDRGTCEELFEKIKNGEVEIFDRTDELPPIAAVVYEEIKSGSD